MLSKDVEANVVFHHLRHEAVHGAAGRGDELQNLGALDLPLKRPLDRLDLAAQAADAIEQLGLFTNGVGHRGSSTQLGPFTTDYIRTALVATNLQQVQVVRSEERRVGKEGSSRWCENYSK